MFKSKDYRLAPLVLQRFNNELDEWEDISGFGKFDSVIDVYHYIGVIINKCDYVVTITMLANYGEWDTIETYKEYISKDLEGVVCEYHNRYERFRIMYQEGDN